MRPRRRSRPNTRKNSHPPRRMAEFRHCSESACPETVAPASSAAMFRIALLLLMLHLPARAGVQLGIDRLQQTGCAAVAGKRIGLITNQTGVNSAGQTTRSILRKASGVKLVALFTPEHGLDGTELAGRYVATRKDPVTGLAAYSLYGPTRKPTPQMLAG